jgi:hypothetical protein
VSWHARIGSGRSTWPELFGSDTRTASETSALHVDGPLSSALTVLPAASRIAGTGTPAVFAGFPIGAPACTS